MEKKAPGRVPVTKDMTFGGVEQIPLIAECRPLSDRRSRTVP